jgi:hypothetical protein
MHQAGFLAGVLCLLVCTFVSIPSMTHAAHLPQDASLWFVNMKQFSNAAHRALTCEQCHPDLATDKEIHPDAKKSTFLKTDAKRTYDYGQCKSCHRAIYERYLKGAHAEALKKERAQATPPDMKKEATDRHAPTCGDCHSGHYAPAHLSRVEMGRKMTAVCGSCHQPQLITYLDNYHGKSAVNLGDPDSAYCTDCHGAHECLSLKDKKAALSACQRCHPKAGESFAEFVIHPVTAEDVAAAETPSSVLQKKARVTLIRVVTAIMTILVLFVVCFFYGHTFVWLLRELHEKLRRHGS